MTTTRILLQGPTTLWDGPPRPWIPFNNATALNYINSIEVFFNGTALNTANQPRTGARMWGTTDLPVAANGAAVLSVTGTAAGRRAGGQAGNNYRLRLRDNVGGTIFGPTHTVPYGPGAFGHHIFIDTFNRDPNGDVWTAEFINSANFEFGLHQNVAAASGINVSYIDFEVLWSGASGAWIAVGVSLLLPLLLPILGDANLYHMNDAELAEIHWMVKAASRSIGETSYPSIVLPNEREQLLKELARPTYGV